ncbi:MAG: hypothetical protein HOH43_13170 [Candidatus Latescibacteria bacterium]|nr:hypothetical protein [Candidatus Latescibacterota bacterium]
MSEAENPSNLMQMASVPGLDLVGGYQLVLDVDTNTLNERGRNNAVDETIRILRARLDGIGIIEFGVTKISEQSIEARVPVSADTAMIRTLLTHNGRLSFRLFKSGDEVQRLRERIDGALAPPVVDSTGQVINVRPFSDRLASLIIDEGIADIVVEDDALADVRSMLADTSVQKSIRAFNRANPPAAKFVWSPVPVERNGKLYHPLYVVNRDPDLVASPLETAQVGEASDMTADRAPFAVRVLLNDAGREDLTTISSANVGKRLATTLNDEILMTLPIQGRISDGRTEIPGGSTIAEARILATALSSGELPAKVTLASSEAVPARLQGSDTSPWNGLRSGLIALLLLAMVFIIAYKGTGLVAVLAIFFQLLMTGMFLRLCIISGITPLLTLSSLVSIALSLLVFAGLHIYLFERLRDALVDEGNPRNACIAALEQIKPAQFGTYGVLIVLSIVFIIVGTGPLLDGALTLLSGAAAGLVTVHFFTRTVLTIAVEHWNLTKMSI